MSTRIRLSLIVLLCISLSACSILGLGSNYEKPEVHITDIRFSKAGLLQSSMIFSLRVDNDNDEAMSFAGGSHRIYLNDLYIGKGMSKDSFTVPRFGSADTEVEVHISNLGMLTKVTDLLNSNALSYRIDSSMAMRGRYGTRRVKTSQSDTFSFAPTASSGKKM